MGFKSIRLQNFKGFKDAKIDLKPLTVILGPNSAGKSCFGQALVALSKKISSDRSGILSLAFGKKAPFSLGSYEDLVYDGSKDQPVGIELETNNWLCGFRFGGTFPEKTFVRFNKLDLTEITISEIISSAKMVLDTFEDESTQSIATNLDHFEVRSQNATHMTRKTERSWLVENDSPDCTESNEYNIDFYGLQIDGVSHLTQTSVPPSDVLPVTAFETVASLLRNVVYLRPNRATPEREYAADEDGLMDDWGRGAIPYVHKHADENVPFFSLAEPTSDPMKAAEIIKHIPQIEVETKELASAISYWLLRLELAACFETKETQEGIEGLVTLACQKSSRLLTDVGFGVSQIIPVLLQGLRLQKGGLLVVEQPETQLHPNPQGRLADFFCSMVKCGRNVLVETHSDALVHRLRALVDLDEDLAQKVAVYYCAEPCLNENDEVIGCSQPKEVFLNAGAEFDWPPGFLFNNAEVEMQIIASSDAKEKLSQ